MPVDHASLDAGLRVETRHGERDRSHMTEPSVKRGPIYQCCHIHAIHNDLIDAARPLAPDRDGLHGWRSTATRRGLPVRFAHPATAGMSNISPTAPFSPRGNPSRCFH